jgi:hypothetical protein
MIGDEAQGDQQEQRVGQRGEDRGGAQAVAEPAAGRPLRQDRRDLGGGEAEHIRQIVAGIGEQGHRVGDEAVGRLDADEAEIEDDANCERPPEIGQMRPMLVVVVPAMRMVVGQIQLRAGAIRMAVEAMS